MTSGPHGALHALLDYFTPLAKVRRVLRGAALLHSGTNPILGANAAYTFTEEGEVRARAWFVSQGAPVVLASSAVTGTGEEVLSLRVGTYRALPLDSAIVVEQVSRLHLASFSAVLCAAWDVPEWAEDLACSLAGPLESRSDVTLFLAYSDTAVGALLERRGHAHLWGVTNAAALVPLLNAAAEVNAGEVCTSVPDDHPLVLRDEGRVSFTRQPG